MAAFGGGGRSAGGGGPASRPRPSGGKLSRATGGDTEMRVENKRLIELREFGRKFSREFGREFGRAFGREFDRAFDIES